MNDPDDPRPLPDPRAHHDGHLPQSPAGLAAVSAAAIGFSWGFILVKAVSLSAAVVAFWRLAIGAAALTIVAITLRIPWPRWSRPVVGAGLSFGVHQLLFTAATKMTSIAIVTLMIAGQPLLVSLVSRKVVGERVSARLVVCSLLAALGVALMVYVNIDHHSRSWQGDLLAGLNVISFTAYFLFAKQARTAGAPTVTLTGTVLGMALLVVAPLAPFMTGRLLPLHQLLPNSGQAGLLTLLALGPGNGHLLVNWAHPRVKAALSSLILVTVPLLSSVWAYLVLHEPLTWRHAMAMGLVAIAVETARRSEPTRPSDGK